MSLKACEDGVNLMLTLKLLIPLLRIRRRGNGLNILTFDHWYLAVPVNEEASATHLLKNLITLGLLLGRKMKRKCIFLGFVRAAIRSS